MAQEPGHVSSERPARDRKRDVRLALTGAVAVLLIWFALANLHQTEIHFWFHTTKAPMLLVIVISAALGAGITALVMRRRRKVSGD